LVCGTSQVAFVGNLVLSKEFSMSLYFSGFLRILVWHFDFMYFLMLAKAVVSAAAAQIHIGNNRGLSPKIFSWCPHSEKVDHDLI
jgi:hypothetical protein